MAKRKQTTEKKNFDNPNVVGLHSAVINQPISETLENNYMPYAMSVIVSRAIPEIDGFKPSHRKLLYTMYKMGLLGGARQKSANIVGRTMQLNPHGDAAIYETMVRLSTGHEALLTPFIDSKGNFGKVYSDMSYAASRYTEARLSPICAEIFRDIDKETVDFDDSYDGTQKEPKLLPTAFPNVLVSANSGIAVGMASEICGFNLNEVCETTINYLNDPETDILSTLPAPDFSTGGEIIYDRTVMEQIYENGKGGFKIRSRWRFNEKENIIEVYEIPYTTTTDIIIDKVVELCKQGKIREINDIRDETDLSGLRIAIELKRSADPEKVMAKLFRMTTLQDTFSCNFNILVAGSPRVMGIREILEEWTAWRLESVRRRIYHDLQKKKDKLHLLKGLERILLDIDKAIAIIRNTELDEDVIPNLMMGFGIDEIQANFVADIKLRNINREYILKRTAETEQLENEIEELEKTLNNRRKLKGIIISELKDINSRYPVPRRTEIVYADDIPDIPDEPDAEDYHVTVFLSKEGYFKKITDQSLRMSGEQKFKENDSLSISFEAMNSHDLLVFSDRQKVYKCRISDFDDSKASALGVFLPAKLGMDDGERVFTIIDPVDYRGSLMFFFENGKAARVSVSAYETKLNRKKLINAYSDKSPLVSIVRLSEETNLACLSSDGRLMVFNTSFIQIKSTKSAQGVCCMTLKKGRTLAGAGLPEAFITRSESLPRYRARSVPSAGAVLRPEDRGEEQLSLL